MMASFVKKVFRLGGDKQKQQVETPQAVLDPPPLQQQQQQQQQQRKGSSDPGTSSLAMPQCPPSPDLSCLTVDEISILNDVFRRQQQFEQEEKDRLRKLHEDLVTYEINLQQHTNERPRHVDLRLCQLCFKVKFTDGVGRVCYDCEKRVCHKCGSFARPRWDPKRSKSVRGKWRCNLCQLKREIMCKTGTWYHGSEDVQESGISATELRTRSLSIDFTQLHNYDTLTEVSPTGNRSDIELGIVDSNHLSKKAHRRRSLPSNQTHEKDEEEASVDTEQFELERKLSRKKRQERKLRKRAMKNRLCGTDGSDAPESLSPESGEEFRNSSELWSEECEEDRSAWYGGTSLAVQDKDRLKPVAKPNTSDASTDSSRLVPCSQEGSHSDDTSSANKMQRQNAVCYSSSSNSLVSDPRLSDLHSLTPSPIQCRRTLPSKSTASSRRSEISQSLGEHGLEPPPIKVSGAVSSLNAVMEKNKCRRITLPHCENIKAVAQQAKAATLSSEPPSNPHEVILHRDKHDSSCRTGGLGMRIVGGKQAENNRLCAIVTMVVKGGPADLQGNIRKGDQILEWNGHSLVDATFEEALQIMNTSGDIVQLVVWHRPVRAEESYVEPPSRSRKFLRADSADAESTQTKESEFGIPILKRKRMLPKTPLEIKKDTRRISGRVELQLWYIAEEHKLQVTLLRAEHLTPYEQPDRKRPNPLVMLHLLPKRIENQVFETLPIFESPSAVWNQIFVFTNFVEEWLEQKALEVTLWTYSKIGDDEFMGEVLLDLGDANLDDAAIWYSLEDHDENSSPLPQRKKALLDISPMSSTSADTSSKAASPSRGPSPNFPSRAAAGSGEIQRCLPSTPAHDKVKQLLTQSKRTPGKERLETPTSGHSSPLPSPVSSDESHQQSGGHRDSLRKKMRRKVTHAVMKVSATLNAVETRESEDRVEDISLSVSSSKSNININEIPSDSKDSLTESRRNTIQLSLLAPPQPVSRTNSMSSFYGEEESEGDETKCSTPNTPPEHQVEIGGDTASSLGQGQVPPKASFDQTTQGDIKLGFMVTKGQLEVNVVCARGLEKVGDPTPPDTYVKTYLMEGLKVVQKKKTSLLKGSSDPAYRQKIKYSACNIMGRYLKINIWEKQKTFDKKQCLGEVVVKLDNLDLSKQTISWYQLYQTGATEMGADEGLLYW